LYGRSRHCEEPTGPAFGRPDDRLRDEAIQSFRVALDRFAEPVIGPRFCADPLARKDGCLSLRDRSRAACKILFIIFVDATFTTLLGRLFTRAGDVIGAHCAKCCVWRARHAD